MKFRKLTSFARDFDRLPQEHQQMFRRIIRDHFLPAVNAGAFSGTPPWPTRLRIHRIANTSYYSLTWRFAGPDGRATFHLETAEDGEPLLVWRRIGTHDSYDRP